MQQPYKHTLYNHVDMKIESNITEVVNIIYAKLDGINVKEMTAIQASTLIAEMKKRIHKDGKASDGGNIGKYSKGYIAVRSGIFKNSGKQSKGVKTVKVANAGKKTKGGSVGSKRTNYNRGTDPKVIISLTGQLENDYIIIPLKDGTAIGFSNSHNYDKSQWVENTYKKKIFNTTKAERDLIDERGQDYINEQLK